MKKILVSLLAFEAGQSRLTDYTVSVCREISKQHKLELLIHRSDIKGFPVYNENITYWFVPELFKRRLLSIFWNLYILPLIIRKDEYGLILLPSGQRLMAQYPPQTIVTVHDLSQYYVPDLFRGFRRLYVKQILPHYLRRAPFIMAISENTKNDLIRLYQIPPSRITVNYNGYDVDKLQTDVNESELRTRFQLDRPYILYNSRIEHPIKNHLHLIRAFELISDQIRENYDLVFTGIDGRGSEEVHAYAVDSVAVNNIRFVGKVAQKDMAAFYKYALVYIFPSLYEGFGIPMLEAMASGIPILCSNRSALPEIGGDAVITFDPEMHADIAVKLLAVLNNSGLRKQLISRGLHRVKLFSWARHIDRMLSLVQNREQ